MASRIVYTPSLEKKSRAYDARKRRRRLYAALACVAVAVAFGGGVAILRHPGAQIKTLAIFGLKAVREEDVRVRVEQVLAGSYAFMIPRSSFFLTRPRTLSATLEREIPRIKTATVVKEFPDTLRISAVERSLWGIACNDLVSDSGVNSEAVSAGVAPAPDAACATLDEIGFAFEPAPHSSGSLVIKVRTDGPPAEVGTQAVEAGLMERLRFLGEHTERSAGTRAVEYRLLSGVPSEIRVLTEQGFELIFRREDDFSNVFRVLRRVLDEEIKEKRNRLEYIDLRFGNKVFYKVRNER